MKQYDFSFRFVTVFNIVKFVPYTYIQNMLMPKKFLKEDFGN